MSVRDALFECEGEMAARLAAHDWSATPLGPVESWSQSLRTSVAIMLRSRYPMILSWGEDLVMLYNDAFIPTLGTKHPDAVGGLLREEFAEVWADIGAMQESVLAGGPATWFEDLPLTIERGTGPEETFFTFSYSHVPDDAGQGGVLAVLTVTTDKVVGARRMSLLHDLAFAANEGDDPDQAVQAAMEVLGSATHDLTGGALYVRTSHSVDTPPTLVRSGVFGEVDHGLWPEVVTATDHPVTRAWVEESPVHAHDPLHAGGAGERPVRWWAQPVRGHGEVQAILALAPNPLRPMDADHERFIGLVADQVGQILAVATARARERARLEALAAIDAAKTAFLSNVSHEFRTPLTLLLAPLEDVLHGRAEAVELPDVEVMHQSAHRLLRMVNALLDVARIEADGLTPKPEPTDLVLLTLDLLQPFTAAAARAGITLQTDLDPDLGPVLTDPELWEKIVLNLVANAIKFTSRGGVTLALTSRADEVVLRVTDTGTGIPSSDVDRVFERFHRVQSHGSNPAEGTGIGLTLVAEAARALGGSARVESEEGVGSTFEVVAPLVPVTDHPQSSWKPQHSAARALAIEVAPYDDPGPTVIGEAGSELHRPAILVVEDNAALRSRVSRLLTSLGRVTTAPDGLAALEVLRSSRIDLVVSDVMMPRLDGLGLLEAIRGDETLRSTPVVLLSARAGAESAAGAIEAGADDYVVKPFTPGELLARCRTSLELAEYRANAAAGRVRSALLAGVSHDMQTPLAIITTALGLLGDPDLDDEGRVHIALRARSRAAQLARLVTQFLDWSRLTTNEPLPVRMEPVDLADVVSDVAGEHERVKVAGDLKPVEIWCDRQRTEQILHNLVENAQRVARSGIEIRVETVEDTVTIRVADDGTGVSPEVLPWLFEAFGPTTSASGSGLGLHVSREAARAQGGTLVLESTGPDGSVFALHLPRQPV